MPSIGEVLALTPKDLGKFSKKMTDEILQAQKDGWRGHINRQGHASMMSPDGEDIVIVSSNREAVNQLQMGINRYHRRVGKPEVKVEKIKVAQRWPCARPNCPKVYATEEHLNDHIAADHENMLVCPEKDCHQSFKRAASLGLHRSRKHGYVSPGKAKRDKLKAAKASKAQVIVDKVVKDVLEGKLPNGYQEESDEDEHGYSEKLQDNLTKLDSEKYDPEFVTRMQGRDPGVDRTDVMIAEHLMGPHEGSLKSVTSNHFDDNNLNFGVDWIPEFNTPHEGPEFIDDDKIWNKDQPNLSSVVTYDNRGSWVMDISGLMESRIGKVQQILMAAGLKMEIRVWRETE